MTRLPHAAFAIVVCAAVAGVGGCSDVANAPPRFQIDPGKAAAEAMRLYDKNADGTLDAKELEASPPLRELFHNLRMRDAAHPDALTAADIRKRLEEWRQDSATLVPAYFTLYLDGKFLDDATVTFEPEPFLGPSYRVHHGKTNTYGMVELDPDLPSFPHFIYVGLYRVRVSKTVDGKELLPARYNTQTTLGRELAGGAGDPHESVMFRLVSK